jgi:UDP-glucose 4-epimerase
VRLHLIDLRHKDAVYTVFAKSRPFDAVIHFAALKAVGESVLNPLLYYDNNVIGTIHLLQAMEQFQCRNIVFSSSATVYGAGVPPILESAPLHCTNPYGRTKLIVEDMIRDLCRSSTQWRAIILRYFNPVGAHGSGLIGEDPRGIPNNLMPFLSQVAAGQRTHVNVFGDDYDTIDGTGVRDYIHVVDLAKGHLAALEHGIFGSALDEKENVRAINLGTGQPVSVLQMVKAMEKASGRTIPYQVVGRRAGDVAASWADTSQAQRILHWQALYDLDRMCVDAWRWQRDA